MHILLTGGGTGGHIVPLLAVAHELKNAHPDCTLTYIGEKGGGFSDLIHDSDLFDEVHFVRAGKFRRYHDESWLQKIVDVKTNLLNIRDAFYTCIGLVQSIVLLRRLKPDAVFAKGGFVCVPVGLSAALLRTPYLTHDSDAVPGLANRIIGRWAAFHATGMPKKFYGYPKDKMEFVGVPVARTYKLATKDRRQAARKKIGVPKDAKMLLITGGSQGSARINKAMAKIAPMLLADNKDLHIFHHVGKNNKGVYKKKYDRLHIAEFYNNFAIVATAADVIVTRAGANSMAEFGSLGKAVIVVPSPFLAGGHQIKNAQSLEEQGAIINVEEASIQKNPELLRLEIDTLLANDKKRKELAALLHKSTKPNAAKRIAELATKVAKGSL